MSLGWCDASMPMKDMESHLRLKPIESTTPPKLGVSISGSKLSFRLRNGERERICTTRSSLAVLYSNHRGSRQICPHCDSQCSSTCRKGPTWMAWRGSTSRPWKLPRGWKRCPTWPRSGLWEVRALMHWKSSSGELCTHTTFPCHNHGLYSLEAFVVLT